MKISIFPILLFAFNAVLVTACEGECIVGITNAFLSNYTRPVSDVLGETAVDLMRRLVHGHQYHTPPLQLFKPLFRWYTKNAYMSMEHAIFPGYFHGKCLQFDKDNLTKPPIVPAGCPNPDCPIVCGTPGSLVHYYSTLKSIAFNNTQETLQVAARPGSEASRLVENSVMREVEGRRPARDKVGRDVVSRARRLGGTRIPRALRREEEVKRLLREKLAEIPQRLEERCGERARGLPRCNWETEMKRYILTFP